MAHGWRTRGYLPHRDETNLIQHVVFNLNDALPRRYDGPNDPDEIRQWIDAELDHGSGAQTLHKPENALIVENCLLHEHGERYALAAWCIMPNHVHVLAQQFRGHELGSIVQTWKSITSHAINEREGRRGALWQREYFDRFMRDEEQFAHTASYIENNPVKAGLIAKADLWRFSSAWAGRVIDHAGEGAGAPV